MSRHGSFDTRARRRIRWLDALRGGVVLFVGWMVAVTLGAADRLDLPYVLSDGQTGVGRLVEIDERWQVTFETADGRRVVPADRLVRWGQWRERWDGATVILPDGGVCQSPDWRWDEDQLVLPTGPLGLWNESKWPRTAVRGIVLQWPASRAERDALVGRLLATSAKSDEVWMDHGDRLQGELRFSNTDEPSIKVRTRGGEVAVDQARVAAIALSLRAPSPAETDERSGAWVGLRDGSCLWVHRLSRNAERVTWQLAGGVQLEADATTLWPEVRFVQPLSAGVTYVSDLTPLGYKHVPFLTRDWPWVRDGSVTGGRLRAAGGLYRKGLGMHSTARLAFDLPPGSAALHAELAIDESAGRRGSVVYRVYLDGGDGRWSLAYESPIVRGGEPPLSLRVDVSGARRLALIVDGADRGDELDHANWLDVRLVSQ